tara:strand:+ start:2119 stop:2418 length:300 start_codon:yes stop_codon:yes gene_type:complete
VYNVRIKLLVRDQNICYIKKTCLVPQITKMGAINIADTKVLPKNTEKHLKINVLLHAETPMTLLAAMPSFTPTPIHIILTIGLQKNNLILFHLNADWIH